MSSWSSLESRWLARGNVRFVAIATLAAAASVLAFNLITYDDGRTRLGPNLGPDYAAFYCAATIVREGRAEDLYDLGLQESTFHQLFPKAPKDRTGFYPYAPFSVLPYVPLSSLPYPLSFLVWSGISLGLFVASLRILLSISNVDTDQALLTLAAISFFPYLMECLLGGQATAIGLLFFSMAIRAHLRGRAFQAGLWLALLSYKPTLLGLVFLLLVVQRQWRIVAGGLAGGAVLLFVSWAIVGTQGLVGYIELLETYVAIRRDHPAAMTWFKYVDLANATPYSWWRTAAVMLRVAALVPIAAVLLQQRPMGDEDAAAAKRRIRFSWAVILACTPVISPHCGVYDSVVIVAAFILVLVNIPPQQLALWRRLAAILYISAWLGQLTAITLQVNVYTCLLATAAASFVVFAARFERSTDAVKTETELA